MRYVWDPAKDALNLRKHELSLFDGIRALEDPERDIWVDDRFEYEEERIVTTGRSGTKVLVVVSTETGPRRRRRISHPYHLGEKGQLV